MAYAAPIVAPRRVSQSYATAVAITPADATQIGPYEALYVGAAGNVVLCPKGQATTVTIAVQTGQILQIAFQGVNATGTTATGLLGLG